MHSWFFAGLCVDHRTNRICTVSIGPEESELLSVPQKASVFPLISLSPSLRKTENDKTVLVCRIVSYSVVVYPGERKIFRENLISTTPVTSHDELHLIIVFRHRQTSDKNRSKTEFCLMSEV